MPAVVPESAWSRANFQVVEGYSMSETNKAVICGFVSAMNTQNWDSLRLLPVPHFVRHSNAIYRLERGRIAEAGAEWDNLHGLQQLGHHDPMSPADGGWRNALPSDMPIMRRCPPQPVFPPMLRPVRTTPPQPVWPRPRFECDRPNCQSVHSQAKRC